jgi:hypothetical protein
VFVTGDGEVDDEAGSAAIRLEASDEQVGTPPAPESHFQVARECLTSRANMWDWDDDVEFLGLSWVEFCKA